MSYATIGALRAIVHDLEKVLSPEAVPWIMSELEGLDGKSILTRDQIAAVLAAQRAMNNEMALARIRKARGR